MSAGAVETEIKLRVKDADSGRRLLWEFGFVISRDRVFEANSVYDTPGGDIRSRGHLLRLRLAGDRAVLTWKGCEMAGPHKSRPETEVEVSDFDRCDRLLHALGYALVFRYDKFRTEFALSSPSGIATLDETPVGVFLELEGDSSWIDTTARNLGFAANEYITSSYGTLYQEYCQRNSVTPGFMTFGEPRS